MAAMVPKGSQRRLLPNPMTHLLLSGAKQTPPPAADFLCEHTAAKEKQKAEEKKQSCSEKRHLVICVGAESVPGFQAALTLQLLQQQLE